MVPELDLDAVRPQRVQHQQAMPWRLAGEQGHRALQPRGGQMMEPCAVQRSIQIASHEVVHARIAQVHHNVLDGRQVPKVSVGGDVFAAHQDEGNCRFHEDTFDLEAGLEHCIELPESSWYAWFVIAGSTLSRGCSVSACELPHLSIRRGQPGGALIYCFQWQIQAETRAWSASS